MLSDKRWHFWKNRPCANVFSMFRSSTTALRTELCPSPPPITIQHYNWKEPIHFGTSLRIAKELANFWNTFYNTKEWRVKYTSSIVYDMIGKDKATILGVRNRDGEIVGTIASIPLAGKFVTNTQEIDQPFYQVECLVIHPTFRNHGLAGWLLGWLDHFTSNAGPVVHCWFRESSVSKLSKMAIVPIQRAITAQISYVGMAKTMHFEHVDQLEWPIVQGLFHDIRVSKDRPFDLLYIPDETQDTTWWRVGIMDYPSCAMVIGIKDTGKYISEKKLYNVVFTCFVRIRNDKEMYEPFWMEESPCPYIRDCIEAAACMQKCDILQVSNISSCGDPYLNTWKNVRITDKKRKLYMYNMYIGGNLLMPI